MQNEDADKTIDVACQFLVQNARTDHQVKNQTNKDDAFRQNAQTPSQSDSPFAIHS